MHATNRFLGSVLLIAGTAIGAGMLALPVLTGASGFFSAGLLMILIWLFNLYVAFIILEATLRLPTQSNLISIIGQSLGKGGQFITVGFLYYFSLCIIGDLFIRIKRAAITHA